MLVPDDLHADGVGADHDGRRHHHGAARGRRAVLADRRRACRCWRSSIGLDHLADGAAASGSMQAASTRSTGCCASRSPASGWSAPSSASRRDASGSPRPTPTSPTSALARRPADGADVPDRDARSSTSRASRCCGSAATGSTTAQMQIGALTAFLTYLMQILMSVMMATFMLMMIPRAAVCAERISEVLDTESSVVAAGRPGHRRCPSAATLELRRRRRSPTRAPTTPVLRDVSLPRRARADHGDHRLAPAPARPRCVNLVPRLFDATGGRGAASTASTCASSTPRLLWSRIGLVPQRPYLFTGTVAQQPALRQARRHRRGAVGGARDRPGRRLRRGDARRAGRADRPGRHQRLRRPAPAAGDRPGAGAASPRSTCSTTRSRRSTSPPTPGCGPRCGRSPATRPCIDRRPAGVDASATPTRSSCSRTAASSAAAPTTSCSRPARRTGEIVAVPAERRRRRHEPSVKTAEEKAAEPAPRPGRRPPGRAAAHGRSACRPRSRRTSARRPSGCSRRLRPERLMVVAVVALAVVSVALSAIGPKILGRATDLIFAGRDRRAAPGRASTQEQAVDGAARPGPGPASPTCSPAMDTSCPGQGIDFDGRRRRCCCSCSALYVVASLLAWLQGYLLNDVVQRTVCRLRARRRGQAEPAAAALLRPQPRGELLSRVTNDIDNVSQTPAADDEPAAHLAADRRRRARDDVLDLAAAGADRAGHGADHRWSSPALIGKRSQRQFVAAVAAHRRSSTRRSRRPSPATRWSRSSAASTRSSGPSPSRTTSCTRRASAPSSSRA